MAVIGFWVFMLIMDLLVPFTMIGFGKLFINKAPESISYVFGYRTAMSMKNYDTWQFAHKYCGKRLLRDGLILLPVSVLLLLPVLGRGTECVAAAGTLVCFIQLVVLAGSMIATETALKKAFDKDGKPRAVWRVNDSDSGLFH